jgi:hypothetical protein
MAILDAPADTRSLEFQVNAALMRQLAAELDKRRALPGIKSLTKEGLLRH